MTGANNDHPRDRLSEYMDDALEVEARASVDRHLADCEDCRAELSAMRRLKRAIAEEIVPPVPPDLSARIGQRVDAATVARPRFLRLVVPTTIAATLGAAALLVALQWREGRFEPPAERESQAKTQPSDELAPSNVPAEPPDQDEKRSAEPAPAPEKEASGREELDKDQNRLEQPAVQGRLEQKKSELASGGIGQAEHEERQRAVADDARRDTGAMKVQNETAGAAAASQPSARFAPAPISAPPAAKANAPAEVSCLEQWTDSGLRGSWDVPDLDHAERELGRVAHAVQGIGLWRGVAEGRPYIVVVPPDRLDEVVLELRARGVTGFPETPPPAQGTYCTGIFVTLRERPAPPR